MFTDTVLAKAHRHPVLAVVLTACFWSSGGVLIKLINWHPIAIAGTRSIIAVLLICTVTRRIPKKMSFDIIFTAIMNAATMILYVVAVKLTSAANAILLQYTSPIFIIILSHYILNEKARWFDFFAVIGVLCGMFIFFLEDLDFSANLGNVLALVSALTAACMTVFLRRQKDSNPSDSFVVAHLITFIIGLPFIITSPIPSLMSIGGLFLLGTLQQGIPSVLYAIGITHISALSAILIAMIEPLIAPIWVAVLYGEIPSIYTIVGGAIILVFISLRAVLRNRAIKKGMMAI